VRTAEEARVSPAWMLLPAALFVANLLAPPASERNAVYQGTLVAAQVVQSLVFILYCLIAAYFSRQPASRVLAIRRVDARAAARLAVPVTAGLVLLNLVLEQLTHAGEDQGITPSRPPHGDDWLLLAASLVVFALIVPLAEELLFRGLAFAAFGRFALPLSAALFAIAHRLPELMVPVFIAGLALGWLRMRTRSILPGYAVHATINALGIVLAVLTAY
jgi:membrane protease YdiL (CAAX protease family)